ncbi:MAG: glycosyltransferase family 2 protein [Candidatus Bathyarchaeota archaeon]|nr:glycosyltransferase family 2 protein [Candidatus Bathyarchaeota archaeon]
MKYSKVRVSIIIVNWNGKKWLNQCLKSINSQEFSELHEIILVDNGSNDDSVKFVKTTFPNVNLVLLDKNYGFAEGNNIGMLKARGDYLIFINIDTQVHFNWLKNLIDCADQNDEYQLLCSLQVRSKQSVFNVINSFFGVNMVHVSKKLPYIIESNFASGGCFLVRRNWLSRVGYLFDSSYFCYSEDVDLSLRTLFAGGKIGYVTDSVVSHFVSSKFDKLWIYRIDIINSLRTFQRLFSKSVFSRILIIKSILILFGSIRSLNGIRRSVWQFTGLVEFFIHHKFFYKKDTAFSGATIVNEKEVLKKISYTGFTGKFIKRVIFNL